MKARHWRCPKCGWTYESPIPVIAVKCPKHKGAGVMMKAESNACAVESEGQMSVPGTASTARGLDGPTEEARRA